MPRKRDSEALVPLQTVQKRIKLRKQNLTEAKKISAEFGLSLVAAQIVAARGYRAGPALAQYLDPTLKTGLPTPDKLVNLSKACQLVAGSAARAEKIAICCDFDVDGLSGGSQLQHFFRALGLDSKVFVPDRFEDGYGLNEKMIRQLASENRRLLICVDYGTSNLKELKLARDLGLHTIVIDHHHISDDPPPCDAFINPQQQGCGFADGVLCASGLVWFFILGLKQRLVEVLPAVKDLDVRTYLDLACLGTICDMVPLTGVNRVIARRGLELLAATRRIGLIALKDVMGIHGGEVSCHDVSFGMGPRLNAAGRMVHGEMVVELLTTDDREQAGRIARTLNDLNLERQATEQEVKLQAMRQLQERFGGRDLPHGLVVSDESFHTGVIGIVAQRLVDTFYRPVVVCGGDSEGILKGSARGIKGFNVVQAFTAVAEHLLKFGGHEGAGGCSLVRENLDDFAAAFDRECVAQLEGVELQPYAEADTEVCLADVGVSLVEELKRFAPFGMANPSPLLLMKGLTVKDVRDLKSTHLKATLTDGQRHIAGMLWRQTSHPALHRGAAVRVVFKPDYNNYNGLTELQAHIQAAELDA